MADTGIDSKRWAGFTVAVLMSGTTGDHLSGFMYRLMPLDIAGIIGPFIGYGFTGILLGLCMFYLLGSQAKYFLKWLPLLFLFVVLFTKFLGMFSAGRAGQYSVFTIINVFLVNLRGFSYLVVLPFVSAITIYFIEVKRNSSNVDSLSFMIWLKSALTK